MKTLKLEDHARLGEYLDKEEVEFNRNWKTLETLDEYARKNNMLLGRIIRHPFADGYAVYRIIKENKKSVRIRVCTGIGDDWVLPAWGEECTIPKQVAIGFVSREDTLRKMFEE